MSMHFKGIRVPTSSWLTEEGTKGVGGFGGPQINWHIRLHISAHQTSHPSIAIWRNYRTNIIERDLCCLLEVLQPSFALLYS